MKLTMGFPPAILSGHNGGKGGRWEKARAVKEWRTKACEAAEKAGFKVSVAGDILVHISFTPANNLGDRVNFLNRCKPVYDGIADAMKVNDKRFLPSFDFNEPQKPGWIEVEIKLVETSDLT